VRVDETGQLSDREMLAKVVTDDSKVGFHDHILSSPPVLGIQERSGINPNVTVPPVGQTGAMQIPALVERVRSLREARTGGRILLGIVGEPGSGKSTVAAALVSALAGEGVPSVVAPMDGFHLANVELERLGRAARKGAIDTFDAYGYLALLERLRAGSDEVVYAPAYLREYEESIGSSIAVPHDVPVVISEGNYLLADAEPWPRIRAVFDEVWFVDTPSDLRRQWLIERHEAFGKSHDAAVAWVDGPDEANARLIRATRAAADLVVPLD
jgi:pantothenate kinase